ncbi:hypothetical protein V3C99_006649 [Haemonchus contortus]
MISTITHTITESVLASVCLFIVVIIVTRKAAVFKNSFFILFVATGIADLVSFPANLVLRLNRELGLGEEFRKIILMCMILRSTTFVAHLIGNMLLTLNRYTAVCLVLRYHEIWSGRKVAIAISFQYLLAIAPFAHLIRAELIYARNSDGTVTFEGLDKSANMANRCIYIGVSVIHIIVCVSLYGKLLVERHRITKRSGAVEHDHREKGLLLSAILIFISTAMSCSQQLIKTFAIMTNNKELDAWATMQHFWINDVMVSIPPFSLLLLCSSLREEIVKLLYRRRRRCRVLLVNAAPALRI